MDRAPIGRRRRLGILAICCLSLFIVGLDVTIVNVALPSIGDDLGGGISGLQWTIDAYTVVMASFLMLAGSAGDRFGRRRVFVTGLTLFAAASLLCSVAPSVEFLVGARVLQALGASMLNPVAMSIVANTFTDPRERAQAIGIWAAVFGVSMAIGPTLGGAAISALGWRSIFWVNVPVGIVAIILTLRFVPPSKAPRPRRFDPIGQLLVITMLAGLTFGIIEAPSHGWGSPTIIAAFAVAAGALVGLLLHEPRREEPLIDLRFFRSVPFSASVVVAITAFATFGGFLFLSTLYLQTERGLSPLQAGLATLPMALMTIVAAPLSGRIVGSRGPRIPLVLAGCCFAVACALLTGLAPTTPMAQLLVAYAIFGFGFGMVNAPVTNTAVSGMPRAQAGVAAAVATTSRQVGIALGVAVSGAIVSTGAAVASPETISAASHPAWWLMTAGGSLIVGLGLLGTTGRARASAERTAAALNPEALVG